MDMTSFSASQEREINGTFCDEEIELNYIDCTQPEFSLVS